jgi:flavin reductase (DIM6/NTAB) family NADH-FMN oxidoreductase RutF
MADQGAGDWAAALGRIPSGLFVLTARAGDRETGMLASWVQQCGFDPPAVSVALGKSRPLAGWLADPGTRLVVNVIPEDGRRLVAHFGKGFDPGEPAFDGVDVDRSRAAAPVLRAAAAYLEGEVAGRADAGDHVLFVVRVTAGGVLGEAKPAVHTRKNGLKY